MDSDWSLRDPLWFLILGLFPAALWWRLHRPFPVWLVPFAAAWHRDRPESQIRPYLALGATLTGFALLVVALARPQRVNERVLMQRTGYDIMLAIDLSPSMGTEDHPRGPSRISRLDAIKPVLQEFIRLRPDDRIGIVVFAGSTYTLAPLTFDHAWLRRQLDRIRVGMIGEGTALGDAVVLALERLRQPDRHLGGRRQGAVVVLITDGVSNSGLFTATEARQLASQRGIPVCTISAGQEGWVQESYTNSRGEPKVREVRAEFDETELWIMAIGTGGEFYRGSDERYLIGAFNAISGLRKIEFSPQRVVRTQELFPWFAGPGAGLFAIGAIFAMHSSFGRNRR